MFSHVPFLTAAMGLAMALQGFSYKLASSYDYTNWFDSFNYQTATDPTHGFVDYISLSDAQSSGLTRIIGKQVFLGVDNTTVLASSGKQRKRSGTGRQSLWLESKDSFMHGLLIGDFAHIPSSACGLWPGFWTIRNSPGPYGESDILEYFSLVTTAFTTLHTGSQTTCTFNPPADLQSGTSNQGNTDCGSQVGCSVQGQVGSAGEPVNKAGGGVYAMDWQNDHINVFFFPRNAIPKDITNGVPLPSSWGVPMANFMAVTGDCDIDANFPAQTIYFDTDFCGAEAGGDAWAKWTGCAKSTGYDTCEGYVAAKPEAFDEAYWLVNSVKVYQ